MTTAINLKRPFVGKTKPLHELCNSITDCHHSTPVWTENGKVVVRNFNIKSGRLDLSNPSFTNEATYLARTSRAMPEPGDLIISREAPMGEVCMIPIGVECCLGQRTVLIKPDTKKVDSRYLLYAMQSEFVKAQISQNDRTGSIVSNLRIPLLKEIEVPLLEGAERIASVLTDLDEKIDCNTQLCAEMESIAKTLYDHWFVQFDFPDENCRPYKTSGGKLFYNSALKQEIPVGWSDGTLEDLGKIVGGSTPSTSNPENFTSNGIPWITPNDLSNNQGSKFISRGALDVTDLGIKTASLKTYPAGTVLLSSRAPIGYMAIARNELTTNQGFKSFIPSDGFSTAYIFYTVQRSLKAIKQYAGGSTFKEVSSAILKTVKIPLPSPSQIDKFTELLGPILDRQDRLEQESLELARLRDWLLPMLMNGQVRVV